MKQSLTGRYYVLITERHTLTALGPYETKEAQSLVARNAWDAQLDAWTSLYSMVFLAEMGTDGKMLIEAYNP